MVQNALVVGVSGGIGSAFAAELRTRGAAVTGLSRRENGLDVSDPASVDRCLGTVNGPFDMILVATGILASGKTGPEKSLDAIDGAAMTRTLTVNAVGPALVLAHAPRLLPRKGRAVVGVLTARVGSIGDNHLGGWYSYRASKAAANQIVHTAAIEIGRRRKEAIVVALHPGTVATRFTSGYPDHRKVAAEEAARNLLNVLEGLTPAQSGGFYDYSGAVVPW